MSGVYHMFMFAACREMGVVGLRVLLLACLAACAVLLAGCPQEGRRQATEGGKPVIIASIAPVAMILAELGADCLTVNTLLPPGSSPHAYEPKPSAARRTQQALALVYVCEDLDGWAARLEAPHEILLMEMLPSDSLLPAICEYSADDHSGHQGHAAMDAHFWTDPLLVRELLPKLVRQLELLDPGNAKQYRENAQRFSDELSALDERISSLLAGYRGRALLMQHPSFQYFAHRYDLELAGLIESAPGKEPSPAYLEQLVDLARERDVRAVFAERQLSAAAARAVAEAAGLPVYELDPLGGTSGNQTYAELLLYNARQLDLALGGESDANASRQNE